MNQKLRRLLVISLRVIIFFSRELALKEVASQVERKVETEVTRANAVKRGKVFSVYQFQRKNRKKSYS